MEHYKRNLERVAAAAVDTLTAQAAAQPQNWQVLMQLGKVHAAAGNGSASQAAVWAAVRRQNSVQFHAASTTALYQSRLVRTVCGCSGPVAQAMLSGRWWAACVRCRGRCPSGASQFTATRSSTAGGDTGARTRSKPVLALAAARKP